MSNFPVEDDEELEEAEDDSAFGMGDDYNSIAYYYDLEYQRFGFDLDFYRESARRAGANARVLELACGAGRLLLPLAQAGFDVTGVDLSEEMLKIARQKLAQAGPSLAGRVQLHQGDMRRLDEVLGDAQFDFVFVAINSFQHLLTQADQLACLRSARRHLAPAGVFVVDVMNPEEKEHYPADGRMEFNGATYNPAHHSTVYSFLSTTAQPADQLRHYHYFFDETFRDGTLKRTVARLTLRYFYRYELQLLLERAGFQIEALYGSYDFEEFGEGSNKLIYVCRRGAAD